ITMRTRTNRAKLLINLALGVALLSWLAFAISSKLSRQKLQPETVNARHTVTATDRSQVKGNEYIAQNRLVTSFGTGQIRPTKKNGGVIIAPDVIVMRKLQQSIEPVPLSQADVSTTIQGLESTISSPLFTPRTQVARQSEGRVKAAQQDLERYDRPDEAVKFYRLKRIPKGETEIPVERYLAAREQMQQMRQYSTAQERFLPSREEMKNDTEQMALGTWAPLGPGNIGGRTRAI